MKFSTLDYRSIKSHPGVHSDLFRRPLNEVRITDFLGGVAHVGILSEDEEAEGMADIASESSEEVSNQADIPFGTRVNAKWMRKEREKHGVQDRGLPLCFSVVSWVRS